MEPDKCTIAGNSDLYGLGIRIGVYSQLLSTIVTNHFLPRSVSSNAVANLIFLLALILAVIRSVSNHQDFYAAECFVVLQLILTFFFSYTEGWIFLFAEFWTAFLDGHLPPAMIKHKLRQPGNFEGLSRYFSELGQAYTSVTLLQTTSHGLLSLAASTLSFWFWVAGVRSLKHAATGCTTYVFLFAPLGLAVSVRAVFILISGAYLTYHSITFMLITFPLACKSIVQWLGMAWRSWSQPTENLGDAAEKTAGYYFLIRPRPCSPRHWLTNA